MTPIEKVARAICISWAEPDELDSSQWQMYVPEARAAIKAMREPSPEMLDAFVARALQVSIAGDGEWTEYAKAQWATMIDAALRIKP